MVQSIQLCRRTSNNSSESFSRINWHSVDFFWSNLWLLCSITLVQTFKWKETLKWYNLSFAYHMLSFPSWSVCFKRMPWVTEQAGVLVVRAPMRISPQGPIRQWWQDCENLVCSRLKRVWKGSTSPVVFCINRATFFLAADWFIKWPPPINCVASKSAVNSIFWLS